MTKFNYLYLINGEFCEFLSFKKVSSHGKKASKSRFRVAFRHLRNTVLEYQTFFSHDFRPSSRQPFQQVSCSFFSAFFSSLESVFTRNERKNGKGTRRSDPSIEHLSISEKVKEFFLEITFAFKKRVVICKCLFSVVVNVLPTLLRQSPVSPSIVNK